MLLVPCVVHVLIYPERMAGDKVVCCVVPIFTTCSCDVIIAGMVHTYIEYADPRFGDMACKDYRGSDVC